MEEIEGSNNKTINCLVRKMARCVVKPHTQLGPWTPYEISAYTTRGNHPTRKHICVKRVASFDPSLLRQLSKPCRRLACLR